MKRDRRRWLCVLVMFAFLGSSAGTVVADPGTYVKARYDYLGRGSIRTDRRRPWPLSGRARELV